MVVLSIVSMVGATVASASHPAPSESGFEDVDTDHTFMSDVAWMKDSGITRGCNPPANTLYCPEDNTTRGEMAAFFHRFADTVVSVDDLGDLINEHIAGGNLSEEAIQWLIENIAGGSTVIELTEEQIQEIIERILEIIGEEGIAGPPGPQGPPGAGLDTATLTLRAEVVDTALVELGGTATAMCLPGEVVISGGYEGEFTLLDDLAALLGLDLGLLEVVGVQELVDNLVPAIQGVLDDLVGDLGSALGPIEAVINLIINTLGAILLPGVDPIDLGDILAPVLDLDDLVGSLIGTLDLDALLAGVSSTTVTESRPVEDGGDWGWQITFTANVGGEMTVHALCADPS